LKPVFLVDGKAMLERMLKKRLDNVDWIQLAGIMVQWEGGAAFKHKRWEISLLAKQLVASQEGLYFDAFGC
jgi:hypothetical protein